MQSSQVTQANALRKNVCLYYSFIDMKVDAGTGIHEGSQYCTVMYLGSISLIRNRN